MALIQTYSGNIIPQEDAIANVRSGEGKVFTLVVKETKARVEGEALTYGFFYQHSTGEICDIHMPKVPRLKTLASPERVMDFLAELYPEAKAFAIQVLKEENRVERGGEFEVPVQVIV